MFIIINNNNNNVYFPSSKYNIGSQSMRQKRELWCKHGRHKQNNVFIWQTNKRKDAVKGK